MVAVAEDGRRLLPGKVDPVDALRGRVYYRPTERGAEKEIGVRLAKWRAWREQQGAPQKRA